MAHTSYIECDGTYCPVRQTEEAACAEDNPIRWMSLRTQTRFVKGVFGSGWQAEDHFFCSLPCLEGWITEYALRHGPSLPADGVK